MRLIGYGDERGAFSSTNEDSGQLIGWVSLLRGASTEVIQASTDVLALMLSGKDFACFARNIRSLQNTSNA